MSIIVEEEKREGISFALLIAGLVLSVALVVTYYLFFIPVPGIEKIILPPQLESIEKISKISLDVEEISNSSVYKLLDNKYAAPPDITNPEFFRRLNPFLPF